MLEIMNLALFLWIKSMLLEDEDLVRGTLLIEKSKEHLWNY
jgi:hypothetical protein